MEAEMAGVFCTRCGHRMSSGEASFCSRCGGALLRVRGDEAARRGVPPRVGESGDQDPDYPDGYRSTVPEIAPPTSMVTTYLLPPEFLSDFEVPEPAAPQPAEVLDPELLDPGIVVQAALPAVARIIDPEPATLDPDLAMDDRVEAPEGSAPTGPAAAADPAKAAAIPSLDAAPALSKAKARRKRDRTRAWPEPIPWPEVGTSIDGCRVVRIGDAGGWLEIALGVGAGIVCAVSGLVWLDPALGVEAVSVSPVVGADRYLSLGGPGSLCLGARPGGALAVLPLQAGAALEVARGARLAARGVALVAEPRTSREGAGAMRLRATRPALVILEVSGAPYLLNLASDGTLVVGEGILIAAEAGVLATPVRQPLPGHRLSGSGSLLLRGGRSG